MSLSKLKLLYYLPVISELLLKQKTIERDTGGMLPWYQEWLCSMAFFVNKQYSCKIIIVVVTINHCLQ